MYLKAMRTGLFGLAICLSEGLAGAEERLVWQDWELTARGEAVVVFSPGRDDAGPVDAEIFLTDLRADLGAARVLDNGAEIGVRFRGRVQLDHPQRSGFSGQLPVNTFGGTGDGSGLAPRGAFTGLTAGGEAEGSGVRAAFETAFAYIDGGYGEVLLGRDIGVAKRFHEGAESVFRRHTVINPSLDTSGLASVLTQSDLSGPAAKISYSTPRLLGLKLGASYAPRANIRGLDRDPVRDVAGIAEPRLEHIAEAAFNLTRRLRAADTRISAYGAFARADVETGPFRADMGTVEVWSLGGRVERDWLSFGADWLTTDNGGGRYRAWSVSADASLFDLDWSVEFGSSVDDLLVSEGRAASFGVSKRYFERFRIGFGVQTQIFAPNIGTTERSTGPVLEMSLQY